MQGMYEKLTEFLFGAPAKVDMSLIEKREEELGVKFPESMKMFYHFFGNDRKMMTSYYFFESLDEIRIENNALMFGYTRRDDGRLGITLEDLQKEKQPVSYYVPSYGMWFSEGAISATSFFYNVACWKVLNMLPSTARIEFTEREFQLFKNAYLTEFSEDSETIKGYKIQSAYYKGVLACFRKDDEELYFAAKHDDALYELEDEANLKFDWL